jgi:sec-independent protein translocase protein TatC
LGASMVRTLRPIGHEDRLSLVDHLDELRSRLIISGVVLAIAFGICMWQNHALLRVINKPLTVQTRKQVEKGQGTVGQATLAQRGLRSVARDTRAALQQLASPGSGLSASARAQLAPLIRSLDADVKAIPRTAPGEKPVTLGVGEPFTTTLTIALYCALIVSLPFILYELYGFILPALNAAERRVALPLLVAVPFLFAAGVAFGYFVVLPAAVRFFVNFNSNEFNVLVQASQFYRFAAIILLAMGLVFQVPVLILGATRLGLVTPRQLRRNRRYAIVACAAVAALLPGDAITLLLETVPLYVLYEASILLATLVARSESKRGGAGNASVGRDAAHPGEPPADSDRPAEDAVQEMIDHVDERL